MPADLRLRHIYFEFDDACLLESKQTSKFSMSLKESVLKKIRDEALALGRTPLVGLEINREKWLMIPAWAIKVQTVEEKENEDVTP